jgi:glycosyltransferase involved in cell wall biosynthesis
VYFRRKSRLSKNRGASGSLSPIAISSPQPIEHQAAPYHPADGSLYFRVTRSDHMPGAAGFGDSNPPLVIASIFRPEGMNGIHTYVGQLRGYLARLGIKSTLVTPFSWVRPLTMPVFGARFLLQPFSGDAGVLWYRRWHEWFLRKALRKHLAGLGRAVIYAQDPLAARAALSARQGPHQSVVLIVHFPGCEADEWVRNKTITMDGRAYRVVSQDEHEVIPCVDGIVFVSESTRQGLLGRVSEAANVRSTVIHNFVMPLPETPVIEPVGDLVTVGRLDPVKNHRFLIDVLAAAKDAGSRLTLDVYGDGPRRRELTRHAEALGVDDQVRFRGFRRDVRKFLPGYRVYVHAAIAEPFGLAVLEAMAAGLPIVAGKVGGISELCEEGVEARFWALDDAAKAAATLLDLLDSKEQTATAGAASRKRFERDFDADALATRIYAFLMSTLVSSEDKATVAIGTSHEDTAIVPPGAQLGTMSKSPPAKLAIATET